MTQHKRSMTRGWRVPVLLLLFAALLAGCQTLEVQQRKWIFMPSLAQAWAAAQISGMDDVWIEHESQTSGTRVKLHALWLAADNPNAPVLLYLHGARRNVERSAFRIKCMRELGFAVLAIDYRGFGRSSDELPSEASVNEDARAGWAWLAQQYPGRDRYIFGHSLGGAIAVRLASEVRDAKGLIVEGTFTSIPAVFQTMKWG